MTQARFLYSGFLQSVEQFPNRPAVSVAGQEITYSQLYDAARRLAVTISNFAPDDAPKLTAIFAYRSLSAFEGIMGSLLAGHGYVPLNRTFPLQRTAVMLERSGCRVVVVDSQSASQLEAVLANVDNRMVLIFPEQESDDVLRRRFAQHQVIGRNDLLSELEWVPPQTAVDDIAYLLFTSGSTGIPKGVMVAHRNVIPFIDAIVARYGISEHDRFSQMFDMTFDLSVFDMFVAWERSACVCCPSERSLLMPARYIRDEKLTIWFSVPSTGVFMNRFRMLKPNSYPGLRLVLFCGEALPVELARLWRKAAPNAILENLYGPTELTIACTWYRWLDSRSEAEVEQGVVPIGYAFPKMQVLVTDENLQEVPPGCEGELLMSGPQLTLGYLNDSERTAAAFVIPPGKSEVYYRTGDRVRRSVGDNPMTHLGRIDFQIKIRGHRVELGEIEALVRQLTGSQSVVALGWPLSGNVADGIEVFVESDKDQDESLYHEFIVQRLPDYMVPKRWHFINRFPLNANGKIDRKQLLKTLENTQ